MEAWTKMRDAAEQTCPWFTKTATCEIVLCLTRVGRLFSSWHAGCAAQINQLWSSKEPGLTTLVRPNSLRES